MSNLGRNEGVTGLLDVYIDGETASFPTIACRVYGWDWDYRGRIIDRSGRAGRGKNRVENFNGMLSAVAEGQIGAFPIPTSPHLAKGTITLTANGTTNTVAMPVRFSGVSFKKVDSRSKNATDVMQLTYRLVVDGEATLTWKGTQTTLTAASQNFLQTDVGLSKTYDPSSLRTSATQRIDVESIADNDTGEFSALATYISSATAPYTGLKVVTTTFHRTGSGGGYFDIQWALRSSADEVTLPQIVSTASGRAGYTDRTSAIVNSTLSAANLRNLLWNGATTGSGFQSVAFAEGLTVHPLHDGTNLVIYQYRNPGATVSGSTRPAGRLVECIVTGTNPQFWVLSNVEYGTGRRKVILSRRRVVGSVIRQFVIFRQLTGTTIPEQSPSTINGYTLPLLGNTNNATFLGLAAGTVMYTGVKYKVNLGLTQYGNIPMAVGYEFYSDSLGIVENVPQSVFLRDTIGAISDTDTTQHWANASALGITGITIPTQGSFNAFIS